MMTIGTISSKSLVKLNLNLDCKVSVKLEIADSLEE